jgi:hypothetical protein
MIDTINRRYKMKPRLFNLLAIVSLLLCILTTTASIRSTWVAEHYLRIWENRTAFRLICSKQYLFAEEVSKVGQHEPVGFYHETPSELGYGLISWTNSDGSNEFNILAAGFGFGWNGRLAIMLPLRTVSIVLLIVPVVWLLRILRERRRHEIGRCKQCGYDLRATPDRCPECGAVPETI